MPFNPTLGNKKHTLQVAVDFTKPTSRNPFLMHLYDDLDSQKRQIKKLNAGSFINVLDYGAKGDGTPDDTVANIQAITTYFQAIHTKTAPGAQTCQLGYYVVFFWILKNLQGSR